MWSSFSPASQPFGTVYFGMGSKEKLTPAIHAVLSPRSAPSSLPTNAAATPPSENQQPSTPVTFVMAPNYYDVYPPVWKLSFRGKNGASAIVPNPWCLATRIADINPLDLKTGTKVQLPYYDHVGAYEVRPKADEYLGLVATGPDAKMLIEATNEVSAGEHAYNQQPCDLWPADVLTVMMRKIIKEKVPVRSLFQANDDPIAAPAPLQPVIPPMASPQTRPTDATETPGLPPVRMPQTSSVPAAVQPSWQTVYA